MKTLPSTIYDTSSPLISTCTINSGAEDSMSVANSSQNGEMESVLPKSSHDLQQVKKCLKILTFS